MAIVENRTQNSELVINSSPLNESAKNQLSFVMHFYQPFRRMRLLSDPSPLARTSIEVPPGHEALKGFRDINTRIYYECYEPMLVRETEHYQPFSRGTLSSCYASLRGWMEYAQPDGYNQMKKNINSLGDERPYRVLGDPFLHLIMADESVENQRLWTRIGKEAFKEDLGFTPKGIWLPETAISKETAQVLYEEGYEYTALRDDQISNTEKNPGFIAVHDKNGENVPFGVIHFDKGRSGPLSYDPSISMNADEFLWQLKHEGECSSRTIKAVYGTDGELYGHHKEFRDKFAQHVLRKDVLTHYNFTHLDLKKELDGTNHSITAELKSPSSWSCDHGVGRWTGECPCGTADAEDKRSKKEMHQQTKKLESEINRGLDEGIPNWRERFVPIVLATRKSMFFEGDIYDDLSVLARQPEFAFLRESAKRDQFLSWYALEVSKISCRLFFAGKNGLERNIGWHNLHQADLLHHRSREGSTSIAT